jgi:hypothetical protein
MMERQTPMADPSPNRDIGVGSAGEPARMPRWVKVFGIIALVVVVLLVILLLTGGPGRHGPGRHTGGLGGYAPAAAGASAYGVLPR